MRRTTIGIVLASALAATGCGGGGATFANKPRPPTPPPASPGPITPQATAQVSVDVESPGKYTVSTGATSGTDASLSTPSSIQPASLNVGRKRASASNVL